MKEKGLNDWSMNEGKKILKVKYLIPAKERQGIISFLNLMIMKDKNEKITNKSNKS